MLQIIKRLDQYTQEDYKMYCLRQNIIYNPNNIMSWAIQEQDNALWNFILSRGRFRKTNVTGYVDLYDGCYPVKTKIGSLKNMFDKMLTPDIYDFEVYYDQDKNRYYVNCYHKPDYVNLFEFVI